MPPYEPHIEAQQPAPKPVIHDCNSYQQGGKAFSDVRAAGKGPLPAEFGGCSIHDSQGALDAHGGRSQVSTAGDGSRTEVYTPPVGPQTTITDAKGNQTYRAGQDVSGGYSQSGLTKDGNAWTMTSDKNGGTSGQTWNKDGTSSWSADRAGRTASSEIHNDGSYSSQTRDQTGRLVSGESGNKTGSTATTSDIAGNTTTTFKPAAGSGLGAETSSKDVHGNITDQQKWSADGTVHAQANATADGSISRTYDKNGQIVDQQQWGKDNSLTHSGTADGKQFSVSSDANGNVYKMSQQDKNGNTTESGRAHDPGSFYSHTTDAKGNMTDDRYWDKNGSQYHGGVDANGHNYSETVSADGNKTSFKDQSGTTNYGFDKSSATSTKSFTSNDNPSKNYEMKTDASGGSIKNANGVTSWDNKGGGSYEKAGNTEAKVSWNGDGVTSRTMTTADGSHISSTTDAQGHVIDHQSYDKSGGLTRTGELSAHGGSYIMKVDANGYPTSFGDSTGVHNYAYNDGRTTDTFIPKPIVSAWGPAPLGDTTADKPGNK
ncbi:MAG TPA: hypothetical protein V6C69_02910 [Trichormus sp.]